MRINENTDVNAFYLFPTKYGLKLASNVCDYKMLYTNTIIPTVSTSINVVHSAHCAIIVCCVCGSLGRWNWSIIKAPMCCHLSL